MNFYRPPEMTAEDLQRLQAEIASTERAKAQRCIERAASLIIQAAQHEQQALSYEAVPVLEI